MNQIVRSNRMRRALAFAAFAILAAWFASACSSSKDTGRAVDDAGACDELASRCHGIGTAIAIECHELGHDGDDARCGPRRAECLAACAEHPPATEDASAPDGNASDGEADVAPSAECVEYCSCMQTSCSTMNNYPFTDPSVCYSACKTFSARERSCFGAFCSEAADSGAHDHSCDHATGKLGTAECP